MGAENQRVGVGVLVYKLGARFDGLRRIGAGARRAVGLDDLPGVVNHIAGDDGVVAVGAEVHAAMAGGVAGCGLQANAVFNGEVGRHHVGEAGVDDRQDAVAHDLDLIGLSRRLPMLPLGLMKQVSGVGKVGTHTPSLRCVFQPT